MSSSANKENLQQSDLNVSEGTITDFLFQASCGQNSPYDDHELMNLDENSKVMEDYSVMHYSFLLLCG